MFAALLTASGLGVSELSNNENVPSHWILRPDCSFLTIYRKRFVESFGAAMHVLAVRGYGSVGVKITGVGGIMITST